MKFYLLLSAFVLVVVWANGVNFDFDDNEPSQKADSKTSKRSQVSSFPNRRAYTVRTAESSKHLKQKAHEYFRKNNATHFNNLPDADMSSRFPGQSWIKHGLYAVTLQANPISSVLSFLLSFGVDYSAPAITGRVWVGPREYVDNCKPPAGYKGKNVGCYSSFFRGNLNAFAFDPVMPFLGPILDDLGGIPTDFDSYFGQANAIQFAYVEGSVGSIWVGTDESVPIAYEYYGSGGDTLDCHENKFDFEFLLTQKLNGGGVSYNVNFLMRNYSPILDLLGQILEYLSTISISGGSLPFGTEVGDFIRYITFPTNYIGTMDYIANVFPPEYEYAESWASEFYCPATDLLDLP